MRLGGQSAAQKQAFAGLGFAALMGLVLVYMVLASQLKSLVDPLVIKRVTRPETGWQAQLILSLPLYDGGLRYGAHDERTALAAEAEDNARQARLDLLAASGLFP